MSETTQAVPPAERRSRLRRIFAAFWSHVQPFNIVLVAIGAAIGVAIGQGFAHVDMISVRNMNQQLQSQGQRLKAEIAQHEATITDLQAAVDSIKSTLEAIMPAKNTYTIDPNQSLIVADGRITVAMIGSPTNEGVNLNINGKQQFLAAGGVIQVGADPANACVVVVQSFDMFKARINATCAGAPAAAPAPAK